MTISRRGFLGGLAAGTLAAGAARAGAHKHFKGHPDRLGLLHDTSLCVGCRSCEFACNEVNGLPPPPAPVDDKRVFDKPRGLSDKLYTVVNRYQPARGGQPAVYRKHQCMHCNEPCCASVCFVKAFTKTPEGPVLYNPDVCVGCRYCVFACPYYALSYEYDDPTTPRVVRCTMCYPRIKKGLNPACADACPTGAIRFGKREDLIQLARERQRKNPERYHPYLFGEDDYGGTSWLTLLAAPPGEMGLPEDLPHEPLPNLTTGFLSMAPLVAAIFPGMLAGFSAFNKRRRQLDQERHRAEMKALREEAQSTLARERRSFQQQVQLAAEQARREAEHRLRPPAGPAPARSDAPREEKP